MQKLIKQRTFNDFKTNLLKKPADFLTKKEAFNNPLFNTELKQEHFENKNNYFEYKLFKFLYTSFEKDEEFKNNFDNLLKELNNCKNIDHISSIFYLFLFIQWWKVEENVYLDSINKLLDFLIKKKILWLFFSSKVWIYQNLFQKLNIEVKNKLIKNISDLFKNEEIYNDVFLSSLDFDFFIKNKKYLVNLKDILISFDEYFNKKDEIFKKINIVNKLKNIFIKLDQCIELKELFNEQEELLFEEVKNKLISNSSNKKQNKSNKSDNNELTNKDSLNKQKDINSENPILKKIEELFLNLNFLFKSLTANYIEYFTKASINSFCNQISFEQIINSFSEIKDLKTKLKDDFMSLININNSSLGIKIPEYALILPSFTRFEVLILKLIKSNNICKISKKDSKIKMINQINEIINFLKKDNSNSLKKNYIEFFKFIKFCFYDTKGFNLRNFYNHEETCEQKYSLNLDKNNTSKFLIALLLYLLNLSI